MKIILVSGENFDHTLKGIGKTTISRYLVKKYDGHLLNFADKAKSIISKAYGVDVEKFKNTNDLFDSKVINEVSNNMFGLKIINKNRKMTMREILVHFCHDIIRNMVDEDYHVKHIIDEIRNCGKDFVVIGDLRYKNEKRLIEESFKDVIHIKLKENWWKTKNIDEILKEYSL